MKRLTAAAVAMTVAACSPGATASNDTPAAPAPPTEEQIAEAQAQPFYFDPALTKPRCPARVDASQYPAPELVGLRLGMTLDEAVAVASCERKDFHVETEKRFFRLDTNGEEIGPQLVTLRNGERSQCSIEESRSYRPGSCQYGTWRVQYSTQAIRLATPGLPGQQHLLGAWRYQSFEESPPTVEATVASLIERFGTPTRLGDLYGTALSLDDIKTSGQPEKIDLHWAWDTSGAAFSAANPRFADCAGNLNAEYNESQRWTTDCGLTVAAKVTRSDDNPAIAARLDVGVMNQQVMWQVSEAMEQHYKDAKLKAQQEEVERAKNAAAPDL